MTFYTEIVIFHEALQRVKVLQPTLPITSGSIIRNTFEADPYSQMHYGILSPALCAVDHWPETKEMLLKGGWVVIERD